MEEFARRFALDLHDFLHGGESAGRVFFGESGTGKTEFAQRIAGLRPGIPSLNAIGVNIAYVSGVDGRVEVKKLADELPPHSVLIIDEADKCLDTKAGMVSAAEATQLHHAIVTHFSRKPIYWMFVGTFAAARGGHDATLDFPKLELAVGRELASRLDFADWMFPRWTVENLLRAVKAVVARRQLAYDDDALLVLVQYCLATGGAVRSFDNLDKALSRQIRLGSTEKQESSARVTLEVASAYLSRLMSRAA